MGDPAVASRTVADLLEALGAKTPSPGGGATAALTGALGAAQLKMVAEYSPWENPSEDPRARLRALATQLSGLAQEDAEAYAAYAAARPRRKEDPAGWAVVQARIAEVPARVAEGSLEALGAAAAVLARAPKWFAVDVAIAVGCLMTAAEGARALCGGNVDGLAGEARTAYVARLARADARRESLRGTLEPLLLARLPAR